jgi:tRNA A37 methylthiotransferase MiaB
MDGQISKAVKEERVHQACAVAGQMQLAYLRQWLGQEVPVLFESEQDGLWRGHTTWYGEVAVSSPEPLHNQVRTVRLEELEGTLLRGRLSIP